MLFWMKFGVLFFILINNMSFYRLVPEKHLIGDDSYIKKTKKKEKKKREKKKEERKKKFKFLVKWTNDLVIWNEIIWKYQVNGKLDRSYEYHIRFWCGFDPRSP